MRGFIAVMAALLLAVPPTAGAWTTFQTTEGFSMEVPDAPVVTATTHRVLFSEVSSCLYTARDGDAVFSANVSVLPRWMVRVSSAETILDRAVGAFLSDVRVRPAQVDASRSGGLWIRRLHYRTPTGESGAAFKGRATFILKDNRLYVFDAAMPDEDELAPATRFLTGVRFE